MERRTRPFVAFAGILFALVAILHVARIVAEGAHPLTEPLFDLATLAALGGTIWAAAILRKRAPKA